jgi:hypothetical protein
VINTNAPFVEKVTHMSPQKTAKPTAGRMSPLPHGSFCGVQIIANHLEIQNCNSLLKFEMIKVSSLSKRIASYHCGINLLRYRNCEAIAYETILILRGGGNCHLWRRWIPQIQYPVHSQKLVLDKMSICQAKVM